MGIVIRRGLKEVVEERRARGKSGNGGLGENGDDSFISPELLRASE